MGKISLVLGVIAIVTFLNLKTYNIAPISLIAATFGIMLGHMTKVYNKKHDWTSHLGLTISYITLLLLFGFITSGGG